ncbi:MAG TPA: histidine phosphatase family protein [Solirubrobacteraceae bacterium]|jgi:phosphohistidine phosphatase|nr:histidine phosphatase family protein [Solirubrobacteraceae bacterium]
MAQQLWFLRHGEAEPHGARPDFDRRLTERGEEQSRAAGRAFGVLEMSFQLVVTSPRIRALDTARLACEHLGCDFVLDDALAGGFELDDALALAHAAGTDKRVLFVGHNPDFAQIIHDLTGAAIDMKKGAIAGVRMHGRRGELLVLMRPREICLIGPAG